MTQEILFDWFIDYFIVLFEFVVGEWICWWRHNINPGYQV